MLLSIIIPCFNSENYLSNLLESLISQKLDDCELIIVNDGSTDNTLKIASEYESKISNIKVIDKQNEGVSVARNVGIENSSGEFIYFLDSDDELTPDTISFFRAVLESNRHNDFISFGYYSQDMVGNKRYYNNRVYDGELFEKDNFLKLYLIKKIDIHICSCIFKKSFLLLNNIYFEPGMKIGEDIQFLLTVMKYSNLNSYYSRLCYIYKIQENSVMQQSKVYNITRFKVYEKTRNIMKSDFFQTKVLYKYSNFWLQNKLLYAIYAYLKSKKFNEYINNTLLMDCKFFKDPIILGNIKNFFLIINAKLIPFSIILKIYKKWNIFKKNFKN